MNMHHFFLAACLAIPCTALAADAKPTAEDAALLTEVFKPLPSAPYKGPALTPEQSAHNLWPKNPTMRDRAVRSEREAMEFMNAAPDAECREIARAEYPGIYSGQKAVYERQVKDKAWMRAAGSVEPALQALVASKVPADYTAQRAAFIKQRADREWLSTAPNKGAREFAAQKHPGDYTAQRAAYDAYVAALKSAE